MISLIIGDFRAAQLQSYGSEADFIFLCEDSAEHYWFKDSATMQLAQFSGSRANTVIMLGFNDCVHSCTMSAFNISSIAADYADTINTLVKNFQSHNFYVCSVNPVDSDYYFAGSTIKKSTLNSKIKSFNSKIKAACKATFIDSYSYLENTGFETRDGVRLQPEICKGLLAYIACSVSHTHIVTTYTSTGITGSDSNFKARSEKPWVNGDVECDLWWLDNTNGGFNPLWISTQSNSQSTYDALPNCTAYVWGRWYEIMKKLPKLSTGKVETWYSYTSDGYQRGSEPKLGAIMCWSGTSSANSDGKGGRGHLAVVEKINSDGSIKTSESAYGDSRYWWTTTRSKGNGNWGQGSAYTFQGFIYCPSVTSYGSSGGVVGTSIPKSQVVYKNNYLSTTDQKANAQYIWSYLGAKGWTINAVAALLGNMQSESTLSPAIWQGRRKGSIEKADGTFELNTSVLSGWGGGFGLVQWTPWTRYTNWCQSNGLAYWDIDSQLSRIIYETKNPKEAWALTPYVRNTGYTFRGESFDGFSFSDFTSSKKDPGWLAAAFLLCYEKPASTRKADSREQTCNTRAAQAEAWYAFLSGMPPVIGADSTGVPTTIVVEDGMRFDNLKLDSCTSTSAVVSFVTKKAEAASYVLKQGSKVKAEKDITVKDNLTTFKISNLTPNTNYTLSLTVNGGGDSTSKSFSFTTLQALPESVYSITISTTDATRPYNNFNVSVSPSSPDFGYWEDNGCGYTIQLIVNGRVKEEKEVKVVPSSLNIKSYFWYEPKITDIIQIGIRTWVRYNLSKLYDDEYAVASNPICMLANDFIAYLTDK